MTSARPPKAASGSPPPTIFPRIDQIRRDAVALLRTAAGDPEAGHDLVEHEQRAARVAEGAQRLEESRLRRDDAHVPGDRLDEHGTRAPRRTARPRPPLPSTSLNGQTTVSAVASVGTPGVEGIPSVASPEPALASSASTWP